MRLLYGRFRRLVRWEYWATGPIYLPVFILAVWNILRYRSLSVVTAANPGMPSGGFVLDSKSEILRAFGDSSHIAKFKIIHSGSTEKEQKETIFTFLNEIGTSFPVVLKPDFGERGKEVCIAESMPQAIAYLKGTEEEIILQEYVPGVEYGIFYERHPNEKKGRITGITEKASTIIHGNGQSTLEKLILEDPRAVCQAPIFLKIHKGKLQEIPASGSKIKLNLLGTHSQGSLFLDACDLWTQEMEDAIDQLSQRFDGFYYGRYDIRVNSLEDLQSGHSFKAVELNGVTSEPTHMYDPKHSIFYAWRKLCGQWNRAFEYGHINRQNGHPGIRLKELLRRIRAHAAK